MVTPFCFQQSNPKSGKISGPSNHSPKDSKPKCLPSPNHTRGWNFPLGCSSVDISLGQPLCLGRSKLMAAPRKNSTEFSYRANKWLVLIRTGPVHRSCYLVHEDVNTDSLASALFSGGLWGLAAVSTHPCLSKCLGPLCFGCSVPASCLTDSVHKHFIGNFTVLWFFFALGSF